MANNNDKTFTISQLEEIRNLDDKDLFLISDYEGGKCYTKKLTYNHLMQFISKNPTLIKKIIEDDSISQKIEKTVENAISAIDITVIDGGNALSC